MYGNLGYTGHFFGLNFIDSNLGFYVGRTSYKMITIINQHLSKTLLNKIKTCNKENKFDNLQKINSSSAIGQHLINNSKCFKSYKVDNFKVVSVSRNEFNLKTLETIYILRLKQEFCKQITFVYSTILFNSLNLYYLNFNLISRLVKLCYIYIISD